MAMVPMTLPPPQRRSITPSPHPPIVATSNDGVLPLDLLYDILLRLPAEPLCRFRAVCRSWRSLLCHPEFIAAAHNPGMLLAVGINKYSWSNEISVVDMESGDAVQRVEVVADDDLSCGEARAMSHDHIVCVAGRHHRLRMIDLASGTVSLLPDHAPPVGSITWSTVWRKASTGEHKVLAIATLAGGGEQPAQVCKIINLGKIDGGTGGWRDTGSSPLKVMTDDRGVAVVDGVAYFLYKYAGYKEVHQIMAFNLIGEAWSAVALRGPARCGDVSLAELEGHLVASYTNTCTELWFLVDSDRSLWSKRYTITMECHLMSRYEYFEKPLAMLDDGRIVVLMWVLGLDMDSSWDAVLRIYDPGTGTVTDGRRVPYCGRFIVFQWNLLRSGQRHGLDKVAKRLLIGRRHHQSGPPTSSVPGANKKQRTNNVI